MYLSDTKNVTSEYEELRRQVWSFKERLEQDRFFDVVVNKLSQTFEENYSLTLVCTPSSTININNARYERLSEAVCFQLHMTNGFPHVSLIKEKSQANFRDDNKATYKFDQQFFSGRKVVLLSDVVTT